MSSPENPDSLVFDWPIDTPIEDAIQETVGYASMCWEFPERAGEFQLDRALAVVAELLDLIRPTPTSS